MSVFEYCIETRTYPGIAKFSTYFSTSTLLSGLGSNSLYMGFPSPTSMSAFFWTLDSFLKFVSCCPYVTDLKWILLLGWCTFLPLVVGNITRLEEITLSILCFLTLSHSFILKRALNYLILQYNTTYGSFLWLLYLFIKIWSDESLVLIV